MVSLSGRFAAGLLKVRPRAAFASEIDTERCQSIMTAILQTGGKQYRVNEGDIIYVEKLRAEDGDKLTLDTVIAVIDGDKITTGTPFVAGASVTANVVKSGKQKKIIVYKMKPKKNYRRKQGHRQPYTKLEIKSIAASKPKASKAKPAAKAAEDKE